MSTQTEIKLAETLNGDHVETLAAEILAARGNSIVIDASEVNRIDTSCLEVLVAAQKLWADEDGELNFSARSEAFENITALLGLEKSMMETGENLA